MPQLGFTKSNEINSDSIYNNYKKIFENSEKAVNVYYKFYGNDFKLKSIDKKDLQQEILLLIFSIIKNNLAKPKEELVKIINSSIGNKIHKIRRECLSEIYDCKTVSKILYNTAVEKVKNGDTCKLKINQKEKDFEPPTLFDLFDKSIIFEEKTKLPFLITELKSILNNLEYQVIYKYFEEGFNLREIGEQLNLTKQRIQQIYKKSLNKIKRMLKNEGLV